VTDSLQSAVLPSGLESEDSESVGNDNSLDLVLRWGNTLVEFESLEGGGTSGGFVGNLYVSLGSIIGCPEAYHSSDGLVEDPGGCSVVERTGLFRVDNVSLC
jgi:hypothetical protein